MEQLSTILDVNKHTLTIAQLILNHLELELEPLDCLLYKQVQCLTARLYDGDNEIYLDCTGNLRFLFLRNLTLIELFGRL